jgi:hypothetical protein
MAPHPVRSKAARKRPGRGLDLALGPRFGRLRGKTPDGLRLWAALWICMAVWRITVGDSSAVRFRVTSGASMRSLPFRSGQS